MAESDNFYKNLPALSSFAEATDSDMHAQVPDDWWIVIADVIGSTKAIEAGAYKSVNTVGVACIAAVVNVDRSISLPFVFGGDGATFVIPDCMRGRVMMALRQAQQLARVSFGLGLRVGLMRVGDLTGAGYWVKLAKVQLSDFMTQPTFSGRGWEEAERLVKTPDAAGVVRVEEDNGEADGSFEGFECRWRGVPSFNGHKLSLLVAAVSRDAAENLATYHQVLGQIQTIYGDVSSYHPLQADKMQLAFDPSLLSHEWRVRTLGLAAAKRIGYFFKMLLTNAAGRYLFSRNLDTKAVKWSGYRQELVENSDFRKFDGMLRMVMDGSEEQSTRLQAYLEQQYRKNALVYGMHKSREALVTCIVQSYNGNHLHFVDGSDGGYALAARELKQRLKQLRAA
ncbi:MAG TPA: DUF3095 domain-containing protein [Methylophilaceae bacterium]